MEKYVFVTSVGGDATGIHWVKAKGVFKHSTMCITALTRKK
jgi:hypothetical protein